MEAIIRTSDKTLFEGLLHFLKALHISVETKEEKKIKYAETLKLTVSKKRPIGLCKDEFAVPNNFNENLPPDIISTFYQG